VSSDSNSSAGCSPPLLRAGCTTAVLHSPTMRCCCRSNWAAGKSHISKRLPVKYAGKGGPDSGEELVLLVALLRRVDDADAVDITGALPHSANREWRHLDSRRSGASVVAEAEWRVES